MSETRRIESIDQFRGLAILLMVLANYLAGVEWIPPQLKHAPDIGLTVIDLVAPFFIFAIGLTYRLSFQRRLERDGAGKTYQHFITRFLAILGIGTILSNGQTLIGANPSGVAWGVLEAIGVAGLLTLPLLRLDWKVRAAAGLGLLALYQFLLDRLWLATVLGSPHGGMLGSLSWAAMLILGTALADLYYQKGGLRVLLPASVGILALGLALSLLAPISKNRVSASYVLVSLAASGLLFALVDLFFQRFKLRLTVLTAWGRSPILLYLLHDLLLGIVFLPGIPGWYVQAPAWLVAIQVTALLGLLSWISLTLNRRHWYFSL